MFNAVSLPGPIHMWIWIPPPPDLIASVIACGDEVEIAVAVHVYGNSACLNMHWLRLDYRALPRIADSAIKDGGIGRRALGDNEPGMAVVAKVAHGQRSLLGSMVAKWKMPSGQGKMLPCYRLPDR